MSYNNTYFETEETVVANFFKKLINWDSWVLLYNQSFINSCPAKLESEPTHYWLLLLLLKYLYLAIRTQKNIMDWSQKHYFTAFLIVATAIRGIHGYTMVSGTVFCDQCKDGQISLFDYPLNGN